MWGDTPGSYAWSEATEGVLRPGEKAQLICQLVRSQLDERLSRLAWRLGRSRIRTRPVDLSRVRRPDSALCRRVEAEVAAQYPPALLAHCYRTWWMGALVGQALDLKADAEPLYVACLMHDIGLADAHAGCLSDTAFQIAGAREARRLALAEGWRDADAIRLYEAISYHLNPWLSPARHTPEALLLKYGAHMDVVGAHRHLVPEASLREIHRRHPREGFREAITRSIASAPHLRGSHAHCLRRLGFARLAGRNPLERYATHPPAASV
ncbi:HD domain-containing protein [Halomonas koreensis]|uniref:HD domain-containing protein n=1 Tax=Halomonas koreensis TaxID=245385 RepID=A0ABU1G3P7_9GAMM|nr:HD domain-containing protein [Halomonas koreensis]MDR5867525.1 HD domain-containing protein [Halomonas koreensis]